MKITKFFLSLIAVLALMVSCSDKFEPTYLGEIKVSSSYVSIPMDSSSVSIEITTADSYEITGGADWLMVSPTSGAAGTSKITFTAGETRDGRSTEVLIKSAGQTQHINVLQGLSVVANATCAEVINGVENKTYRVTGVCTAIANTQYGNFYLNDGTGEVYIYGTVNSSGAYDWANFGIEVGDEVTVEGPMKNYNGTIELVDAAFISVSKSLIKCDSISTDVLPSDGGDVTAFLINKGDGIFVEVPADAQSWLSIKSIAGNEVTFHAAANTAGPRNTTIVFKTKKSGKEYTSETTISQLGLSGTKEVPFTVAEAIAYCQKLTAATAGNFYVKGIVTKIKDTFSAKYGNGTFWISDDGNCSVAEDGKSTSDLNHDFEVYQTLWFGNKNWVEGNLQISEGDEVVVCGQLTNYKGTAETNAKMSWIVSVNGVDNDANGFGSKAYPFSPEGACQAAFAGSTNNVYVAGKVAKFPKDSDKFNAQYGNASFWMSKDGNYAGDKSVEFEAYRVMYLGNRKWVEGDIELKQGDDVVIYGPLTTYNGTAETQGNKGYIISINGKTE